MIKKEKFAVLKSHVEMLKQRDKDMSLFCASSLWRQKKIWPPGTTEESIIEKLQKENISEELLTREQWIKIELFDFKQYCKAEEAGHLYQFNPCSTEAEIIEFEQKFKIKLPEEYSDFLLYMGNGGAGPDYGILSLEKSLEEISDYLDPDEGAPQLEECLSQPFILPEYPDDESKEYDGSSVTGMLPICEVGCGHSYQLCVSGPEKGSIWFFNANYNKFFPVNDDKCLTFLEWYKEWLYDNLIRYSGNCLAFLLQSNLIDPKQYQHLSFATSQLITLPPEIIAFSNLESLDLSENQLETLPDELAKLPRLRWLHLVDNKFFTLPDIIYQLNSLEYLNISGNRLRELDSSIEQLNNLRELVINDHHNGLLTTLPDEIGNLSKLKKLSISKSKLESLPKSIGKLTCLEELFLYENCLTSLPKEIGALENLVYLELSDNKLKELPPEISQLKKLTRLGLDKEVTSSVPSEMKAIVT